MSNTPKKTFKDTKLGKELALLKKELAPMSWTQRIDHIWTYYKEYIIVFLVGLVVCIGLITSAFNGVKDTKVTGILANVHVGQDCMNFLSQDYAAELGLKDPDLVRIEYTEFEDPLINVEDGNYYAAMVVENEVSAQMLDYMILDHLAMEFLTTREVYLDLRKFFTEEELYAFAVQDRIIYCMEENDDAPWPAAIKITNTDFVKDYVSNTGDIYFAVAGSSQKLEAVRGIWERINYTTEKTLTGITLDVQLEQKGVNFLTADYATKQKLEAKKVSLEQVFFQDLYDSVEGSEGPLEKLVMDKVNGKTADYFITTKGAAEFYMGKGAFMDLRNFFTATEIAALAEAGRLIYSDKEQTIPVGVKLTKTEFATNEGELFLAVAAQTAKADQVRLMWDYLNA